MIFVFGGLISGLSPCLNSVVWQLLALIDGSAAAQGPCSHLDFSLDGTQGHLFGMVPIPE